MKKKNIQTNKQTTKLTTTYKRNRVRTKQQPSWPRPIFETDTPLAKENKSQEKRKTKQAHRQRATKTKNL